MSAAPPLPPQESAGRRRRWRWDQGRAETPLRSCATRARLDKSRPLALGYSFDAVANLHRGNRAARYEPLQRLCRNAQTLRGRLEAPHAVSNAFVHNYLCEERDAPFVGW